jgi:hypothetical protein
MRRETAAKEVLQVLLPGCTVELIVTSITDAVATPESYWFRSEKLDRKIGAESLLGWCTLEPPGKCPAECFSAALSGNER